MRRMPVHAPVQRMPRSRLRVTGNYLAEEPFCAYDPATRTANV